MWSSDALRPAIPSVPRRPDLRHPRQRWAVLPLRLCQLPSRSTASGVFRSGKRLRACTTARVAANSLGPTALGSIARASRMPTRRDARAAPSSTREWGALTRRSALPPMCTNALAPALGGAMMLQGTSFWRFGPCTGLFACGVRGGLGGWKGCVQMVRRALLIGSQILGLTRDCDVEVMADVVGGLGFEVRILTEAAAFGGGDSPPARRSSAAWWPRSGSSAWTATVRSDWITAKQRAAIRQLAQPRTPIVSVSPPVSSAGGREGAVKDSCWPPRRRSSSLTACWSRAVIARSGVRVCPLVPIANRPLVLHVLDGLRAAGVREVAVLGDGATRAEIASVVGDGSAELAVRYIDHVDRQRARRARVAVQPADAVLNAPLQDLLGEVASAASTARSCGSRDRPALRLPTPADRRGAHVGACLLGRGGGRRPRRLARRHRRVGRRARRGADRLVLARTRGRGPRLPRVLRRGRRPPAREPPRARGPAGLVRARQLVDTEIQGPALIHPTRSCVHARAGPCRHRTGRAAQRCLHRAVHVDRRGRVIEGAEIEHSLVLAGAEVRYPGVRLTTSIIGPRARLVRDFHLPRGMRVAVGADARGGALVTPQTVVRPLPPLSWSAARRRASRSRSATARRAWPRSWPRITARPRRPDRRHKNHRVRPLLGQRDTPHAASRSKQGRFTPSMSSPNGNGNGHKNGQRDAELAREPARAPAAATASARGRRRRARPS